jgi:hypothetical protein
MSGSEEESEWVSRVRAVANDAIGRATASTTNLQRLLLAIANSGVAADRVGDELNRLGQQQAMTAYYRIAQINADNLRRFVDLVTNYQTDYVGGLVSTGRLAAIGRAPTPPAAPTHHDATEWAFWLQRMSAWATDHQQWNARVYRALAEEAASGSTPEDRVRSYGMSFVEESIPAYIADVAEASFASFCDLLELSDDSLRELADTLLDDEPGMELTIDVNGVAAGTVATGIVIENNHDDSATVSCVATAADEFCVEVEPVELNLAAGDSQQVRIYVTLPAEPATEPVAAGVVTVTGHQNKDLTVRLRATVRPPDPGGVSVRVLDDDVDP